MSAKVFLASDHGGFDLKQRLQDFLIEEGHEVVDLGPDEYDGADDYPDYVKPLVEALKTNENSVGILSCRSAQGVAIAANRNSGIRAVIAWNEEEARKSREHNDANVLCLSGDHVDTEQNLSIVREWLGTSFTNEERHRRRLDKIEEYFST